MYACQSNHVCKQKKKKKEVGKVYPVHFKLITQLHYIVLRIKLSRTNKTILQKEYNIHIMTKNM